MTLRLRTADRVVIHNATTGLPEVIQKQDKDPNKWEWFHKIIATILGVLITLIILHGLFGW